MRLTILTEAAEQVSGVQAGHGDGGVLVVVWGQNNSYGWERWVNCHVISEVCFSVLCYSGILTELYLQLMAMIVGATLLFATMMQPCYVGQNARLPQSCQQMKGMYLIS